MKILLRGSVARPENARQGIGLRRTKSRSPKFELLMLDPSDNTMNVKRRSCRNFAKLLTLIPSGNTSNKKHRKKQRSAPMLKAIEGAKVEPFATKQLISWSVQINYSCSEQQCNKSESSINTYNGLDTCRWNMGRERVHGLGQFFPEVGKSNPLAQRHERR